MKHLGVFCSLVWLMLASTGCNTILGDFTVGPSADAAVGDATVLGSPHDGSSEATAPSTDGTALATGDGAVNDALPSEPDAGDSGAGPDSGVTCVAGGSCAPGDCQNGTWACVDGGRVCQETTAFDAGTPCGAGGDAGASVCSAGRCVACNAGGDCSDPSAKCVKKSYDCGSGTAVCTVSGNVPDGTSCGTAGTALYCNAGACAACQVGTSCQPAANACHVGKITACTAGIATCTDSGTAAAAGTSCSAAGGASGACDGNGSCLACAAGAQCNPNGNQCQVGVESCSAGVQCTNPVAVHEGQTCGTGLVCHDGTCTACDGTTCPAGCCDGHGCVTTAQTVTECGTGTGGAACTTCSGPSTGADSGSAVCSANACTVACSGTDSACHGACVNFKNDDNSCGSCGHVCAQGSHCNGSGTCSCIPAASPCESNNCGMASDGCGGMVSCGTCAAPKVCSGAAGGPGTCGCTATSTCKSLGDNCGSFVDECKVTQTCGTCTAPDMCTTGANGAGTCSCKATDSCASHGFTCGSFTDSCGNTPNCGSCQEPKICSGANGGGGTCSCTPTTTCASLKATCGSFVDSCGNTQNCGTCAAGAGTCSGAPGTCGGCNTAVCGSSNCGSASEGTNCPTANCGTCKGSLTCSSTTGPGTCGCSSGLVDCSGACVSTLTDSNNCASCGNVCGSGLHCVSGSCTCDVTSCPSGCCVNNTCTAKPVWYPDSDGDGYGDEYAQGLASCVKPSGATYVTDHTDCCDVDPVANPGYLAANSANPWQIVPDKCDSFLWNCEASGIPVLQLSDLPPCPSVWQTCMATADPTGAVSCTTGACAQVCPTAAIEFGTCTYYGSGSCGNPVTAYVDGCTNIAGTCTVGINQYIGANQQGCY